MQTHIDSFPSPFHRNRGAAGAAFRPMPLDEDEVPFLVVPDFSDRLEVPWRPPVGVLLGDFD